MQESISCAELGGLKGIAARLLEKYPAARVFAFYGTMGAGKTTFIRELCNQLEVTDVVNSPTFAIVNEYIRAGGGSVYHFDLYRLKSWKEMLDIGYEEYFYSGNYCLIEWPELIGDLLPEGVVPVEIRLTGNKEERVFTF